MSLSPIAESFFHPFRRIAHPSSSLNYKEKGTQGYSDWQVWTLLFLHYCSFLETGSTSAVTIPYPCPSPPSIDIQLGCVIGWLDCYMDLLYSMCDWWLKLTKICTLG